MHMFDGHGSDTDDTSNVSQFHGNGTPARGKVQLSCSSHNVFCKLFNGGFSSKGSSFGPTLWKVRGRGLDLIGRWRVGVKNRPIGIEYMFLLCLTRMCVNSIHNIAE